MEQLGIDQVQVAHFTQVNKRAKPPVHLPGGPGVYLLKDSAGLVVYVGMSSDLARRVRQHWYPHTGVAFFPCDESSARWIEKRLIAALHPKFNTKGVGVAR